MKAECPETILGLDIHVYSSCDSADLSIGKHPAEKGDLKTILKGTRVRTQRTLQPVSGLGIIIRKDFGIKRGLR